MIEFNHNGIQITLNDNGTFSSMIGGKYVTKSSLAAMKKFIDEKAKNVFQPFDVISDFSSSGEFEMVESTVTALEKTGNRKYGAKFHFTIKRKDGKFERYGNVKETVILDTPTNRKLLKEMHDYAVETQRISTERRTHAERLKNSLKTVKADEYAAKVKEFK
jgi:hypothetical protein